MSPKLKPPIKKIFPSVIYLFFFIMDSCSGSNSDGLSHWSVTSPAFSNTSARLRDTTDKQAQPNTFVWAIARWDPQFLNFQKYQIKTILNGTEPMKPPESPRTWSHLPRGPWQRVWFFPWPLSLPMAIPAWSQYLILVILQLVWQLNQYLLNLADLGIFYMTGMLRWAFSYFSHLATSWFKQI